jgi:hypothetical protein
MVGFSKVTPLRSLLRFGVIATCREQRRLHSLRVPLRGITVFAASSNRRNAKTAPISPVMRQLLTQSIFTNFDYSNLLEVDFEMTPRLKRGHYRRGEFQLC